MMFKFIQYFRKHKILDEFKTSYITSPDAYPTITIKGGKFYTDDNAQNKMPI